MQKHDMHEFTSGLYYAVASDPAVRWAPQGYWSGTRSHAPIKFNPDSLWPVICTLMDFLAQAWMPCQMCNSACNSTGYWGHANSISWWGICDDFLEKHNLSSILLRLPTTASKLSSGLTMFVCKLVMSLSVTTWAKKNEIILYLYTLCSGCEIMWVLTIVMDILIELLYQ